MIKMHEWVNGYTVFFEGVQCGCADISIQFDDLFSCLGYYHGDNIDFYFCKGDNIDFDCIQFVSCGDKIKDACMACNYFDNNLLPLEY